MRSDAFRCILTHYDTNWTMATLFRQSTLQTREKTSTTSTTTSRPPKVAEATEDQGGKDEIFEEYFDYLYDVGALEKKTTTPEPKQRKIINRLRPRKGRMTRYGYFVANWLFLLTFDGKKLGKFP